jgi:branched-chain amino acid transport system permease protein
MRGYWIRLLTNVFMFAVLAESVNIIAGYCGYLALGNMLFFGLGAYVEAVLMAKFGFTFFTGLIMAGLVSSLFAVVVGFAILRLKGFYFIMGTVALMELLREVTINLSITGGGKGIMLPLFPGDAAMANIFFYYFMLGLMFFSIACTFYISKTYLGYAFRAIKLDEDVASVMGINPTLYKTAAWSISAFFTGLAGAGYAYWMSFIEPGEVYHLAPSVKIYLMMVLGGGGTVLGPILGAFFIEFVSELIWGKFLEMHLLLLGVILVLTVIFAPKGFVSLFRGMLNLRKLMVGVRENRV